MTESTEQALASRARLAGGFVGESLYRDLLDLAGSSPPHSRVRPERKLALDYGLSHSTTRRVIARLQEEGHLYKVHGKGVFVAEPAAIDGGLGTLIYLTFETEGTNAFFHRRLSGLMVQAQQAGFRVQVLEHSRTFDLTNPRLQAEIRRPDVVGITVPYLSQPRYACIKSLNPAIKIVCFNDSFIARDVAAVWVDFEIAAQLTVDYLLSLGRRRLAVCTHLPVYQRTIEAVLRERGHGAVCRIFSGWHDLTPNAAQLAELRAWVPDGVAFADDMVARAFVDATSPDWPTLRLEASVVALANIGNPILPAWVQRVDIDGRSLGIRAGMEIQNMLSGADYDRVRVLIGPTLRTDGADATALGLPTSPGFG